MTPVLETERLLLRRLQAADLEDLFALYRDPEIRRFFPEGTLTRAQTEEELDWFVNGGDPEHPGLGLWATIHKPSGRFIGRCGLIPWTVEGRLEIEIAYLLAKEFWRQGLGAEVAAALVRHGFGPLGLARLIAFIDRGNAASQRTAVSAGLAFEREIEMDDTRCDLYAIARCS